MLKTKLKLNKRGKKSQAKRQNNLNNAGSKAPTIRTSRGGRPNPVVRSANSQTQSHEICVKNFLTIRANPFAKVDGPLCNPIGDSGYYVSYPVFGRYNITIGTAGCGYFIYNPYALVANQNVCRYTSGTYAGNGIDSRVITTGVIAAGVNTVADWNAVSQYKLIGVGCRAYSTSAPLAAKGAVYSVRWRQNTYDRTTRTQAEVVNSMIIPSSPFTNGVTWEQVYMSAGNNRDDQWIPQATFLGDITAEYWTNGIYVAGANPGDTFTVELCGYIMVQHQTAVETSYQPSDPRGAVGAGIIAEAYSFMRDNTATAFNAFLSHAGAALRDQLSIHANGLLSRSLKTEL